MDHNFTQKIQEWLDQPAKERDYSVGLQYLLKLSNNIIMYRNLERNPEKKADFIEYQIRKYQKFRLSNLTHEEVSQMQVQVAHIAKSHNIECECPELEKVAAQQPAQPPHDTEFKAGKREDHDSLPAEIQALYVENASIMQRMRELHLKLRTLSGAEATCPDSDRYPFLKEIIALDKQYHANWKAYDEYQVQNAPDSSATSSVANVPSAASDSRMEQKNILRQINLNKGRYKKSPTEALKDKLASLYSQLASPTDKLTAELKELGVIS